MDVCAHLGDSCVTDISAMAGSEVDDVCFAIAMMHEGCVEPAMGRGWCAQHVHISV